MDEEQEILQSSITQGDKISIDSFFGSPIGGLANRAIMQSNSSLKSSITNRGLISSLQASIELLKSQVRQITNYVLIDRQERNKLIKQSETQAFQREDDIQKGIVSPENAQPRGLEDSLPFFPENRFSQGLTAGMSSIGEPKGVAKFQQEVGQEVEGSTPFFFGGLVPGSGNADTIDAKLTPGEFVVPKNTVENLSPNFFKGLISSSKNNEKVESNDNFTNDSYNLNTSIQYSTRGNPETGQIEVDPNSLEHPFMLEAANQQFYQDKVQELESEIFDAKLEAEVGGYKPNISHLEEELNMYKGKYDDTLEYGTRYGVGGNKDNKEDDKEGGFFKNLFGKKKNENVRSDEKEGRGLFGAIGGTIDAATGNLTDFDKKGGKPFGLMRGITGTIDAATGGLTDLDRRGGKPFGLMRGITGSIDAMTGGLTDLDRRGGKPFGTMRLATGMADAMTGNLFDFDRRGKGGEMKKGFSTYSSGFSKENYDMGRLSRKDFKNDEDYEFYLNQFDDFDDKQLQNKANQLPMKTTVNPDGSITSKGSGTLIGGELVKPGEPLSPKQRAAITMGIQMGNTYSSEIMENYNNSGGSPSKEEFDNYEKEKSENIRPEEEKSKNLKPEQTLGERFMNMFRGDKKEKSSQLLSSGSVEPASKNNLKVSPSESIKETSQSVMSPPPPPESETIELPPQIQGAGGGSNSIPQAAPSFQPSTPSFDPLTGTESSLIFVEVISNPFLSIP